MSIFIGIFFTYIHKKEGTFGFDTVEKGLIVAALVIMGLAVSYSFKLGILDFIISSEINILAFYFIISYASLTSLASNGFITNFLNIFITIGTILKDPTTIFEKGYSLIVPIVFFLIPLFVLLYNFTQSVFLPFLVFEFISVSYYKFAFY